MRRISMTTYLTVVLMLVATACGDSGTGSTGDATPTSAGAASTAADSTATAPTTVRSPAPTTTRGPRPDAGGLADGPLLVSQYTAVEPGTYRTEKLGWPLSFTTIGEWWVQPNEPGRVVLTHPDSIGPGDRDVVFFRPTFLADPTDPTAPLDSQQGYDDLNDIDGWLDSLVASVPVTNRRAYTLGTYDATAFDVRLPDGFPCGPEACSFFADSAGVAFIDFFPDTDFRVYWVDGGDYEPLAVWIGGGPDPDWFAAAEALLDTVALGEPGPHPLDPDAPWEGGVPTEVPAGRAVFPAAGGVALTLDEERFVFQNNGLVVVTLSVRGGVTLFKPVSDGQGVPIDTVDEVIAAIRTSPADITEVELDLDLAYDARVLTFRASGVPDDLLLKWDDAPDRGAAMDRFARIWILDTPRGPMVATAQTDGDETTFEVVVDLATRLLPTLELVDLP